VRVARSSDGLLQLSRTGPGRGAWLCRDADTFGCKDECVSAALKGKAFVRAFRAPVGAEHLAALRASTTERANMEDGAVNTADEEGIDAATWRRRSGFTN